MDPPYAGMAIMNFMEKDHNAETVQNNGHNPASREARTKKRSLSCPAYALWCLTDERISPAKRAAHAQSGQFRRSCAPLGRGSAPQSSPIRGPLSAGLLPLA